MSSIRIYTPFFPYPLHEAAFQTIFQQAHDLRRLGHTVHLITWKDDDQTFQKKWRQAQTIGNWDPRISVSSWARPNALPPRFRDRLYRVVRSFFSEFASPELFYYPPDSDRRSAESLSIVDLEIYHYSFAYAWLKKIDRSRARKIVVHFHNLEHELFDLRAHSSPMLEKAILKWTAKKLKAHELALPDLSQEIWQVTEQDLNAFSNLEKTVRGSSPVQRLATPTWDEGRFAHRSRTGSELRHVYRLGFIGGLDFEPNRLSIAWIIDHLAPLIQNRGKNEIPIEIIHAGKRDAAISARAKQYPFIQFLGFVDDIEAWWRDLSWTLVPDVTGCGVRMKLLESLASKVPALATGEAAARIPNDLHRSPGLFVSDSPAEWLLQIQKDPPFSVRLSLAETPFPAALRGDMVYGFLDCADKHCVR